MTARPLVLISAAAMLGSFFLPWTASGFGSDLVPWTVVKGLDSNQIKELVTNLPPEGMAFAASFALAALLLLLGVIGASPRLIVLVAGALPVGLVAWAVYSAVNQGNALGLPVSGNDVMQVAQDLSGLIGTGAWVWLVSGAVLLLIGLFGPGEGRA